jgi:OOP family OmpA-OmpF porin
MNARARITALLMMAAILAGCASMGDGGRAYDQWRKCVLTGAVVGGATGAAVDSAAPAGAAAGAVIGAIWCAARPGDADGDGVRDEDDRCPGTTAGVEVDQNGCEPDFDGDGVPDRLDECPDTPSGARVDASGCELDSDGDGVVNSKDRCPRTPAGAGVDANGCELDGDGDGVVDSKDKCPETAAGQPVDNDGCDLVETYTLNGVYFEFDSAKLTADSKAALDDALEILQRHPGMEVEIAGHTDSVGTDEYNQGLSDRRARSVLKYLVEHGASADMLTAKGYGESEPVADNETDEGRARNRRVEMRHD